MTEADGVDEAVADAMQRAAAVTEQLVQLMLKQRETTEAMRERQLELINQLQESLHRAQELHVESAEELTRYRLEEAEAHHLQRESQRYDGIARKEQEHQRDESPEADSTASRQPKAEAERLHHKSQETWNSSERRENLAHRLEGRASKEVIQARLRADACQAKPPSSALSSTKQATSRPHPHQAPRTLQNTRGIGTSR